MFKDREKMYQIYHAILGMALAWALTIAINQYYNLRVHVLICALFSLIMAVIVYFIDLNRRNPITYLILAGLLPAAGLLFWILHINPWSRLMDLAHWVWIYDGSMELYNTTHAHILVLMIGAAAAILFYILMKYEWIKILLSFLIFGAMILCSIRQEELHKIVVGVGIFYMLSNLVEQAGKQYNRKVGRPDKKEGILYLAPLCLILAVIAVSMPSKAEPIQWTFVKNIYHNIKDRIDHIITEWEFFQGKGMTEFSLAMTGYSEEEVKLGVGEIIDNDKVALTVSGFSGDNPVYLIGSVSDIYTGNSWKKSREEGIPEKKEYLLDYYELLLGLSRVDLQTLEDYRFVQRRLVKIVFDNIKTKTFFYPLKSSWYEVHGNTAEPADELANITFPRASGEGTTYEAVFYELNLKGENFQQMLKEADQFSYATGQMDLEKISEIENDYFYHSSAKKMNTLPDIYSDLKTRADNIKKYYTGLPEELPDRVKELAYDITKDADTTYDKLKAIEEYLNTYTYSVTPGNLPEGKDFVDYFLFENKQGFCTSFASSMAILGRCVGIPTRYVEGFLMDSSDKGGSDYQIRHRKAHAWVEAYIEGVGWIPFEATPPFYDYRYKTWPEFKKNSDSPAFNMIYEPTPAMPQNLGLGPTGFIREEKLSNTVIGAIIVGITILTLILLLAIYDIYLRLKYRKSFRKADYSGKTYLLFLRILAMLKREGYSLGAQDTILMLSDRIKDFYHYDKVTFRDVAEVYMRYRYGQAELTEADYKKAEVFHQGLLDMHRAETGRVRMHLEEFFFLAKRNNRYGGEN